MMLLPYLPPKTPNTRDGFRGISQLSSATVFHSSWTAQIYTNASYTVTLSQRVTGSSVNLNFNILTKYNTHLHGSNPSCMCLDIELQTTEHILYGLAYQTHLYQHLHPIPEKHGFHLFGFSPILHQVPYQGHLVGRWTIPLSARKKSDLWLKQPWN